MKLLCPRIGIFVAALLLLVALVGCNHDSQPQSYPSREITVVVPFGAGGGTDSFARVMKRAIEENNLLPQPLVIKNISGAGATIGSRYVKNAKPDGYTVLLLHDAILTAKAYGEVQYGAEAFDLVAGTAEFGMIIAVNEDSDYHTLNDLLDAAEKAPDTIRYGVNLGALTHFAGLELEQSRPGAKFLFVQNGGGADRFQNLKGGHIDVSGFSIEEFARYRSEGLRGLAYLGRGDQPHGSAPNIPTATQQGVDVVYENMFYWWVPEGTPKDRVAVLARALRKAMKTETMQRELKKVRCKGTFLEADQARRRVRASADQYEKVQIREVPYLPNIPLLALVSTLSMLGVVVLESARRRARFGEVKHVEPESHSNSAGRVRLVIGTILLTAFYVAAMWLAVVPFPLASSLYIVLLGMMLTRWNWKRLPVLLVVGFAVGYGVDFVFREYLTVNIR